MTQTRKWLPSLVNNEVKMVPRVFVLLLSSFGFLEVWSHGGPVSLVQSLDGEWKLWNSNKSLSLPARVPGCVHTALQEQGFIKDPYFRFNDLLYEWISLDNWTYASTFAVSKEVRSKQKVLLVLDGVDTAASIWLNGVSVGHTDNMFRQYVFPVRDLLTGEENVLTVHFLSPVLYAAQKRKAHSAYAVPPECPPDVQKGQCHVNFIRKAQSSFSWDWGPSFPGAGLWKGVRLEAFDLLRLDRFATFPLYDAKHSAWTLVVEMLLDTLQLMNGVQITLDVPELLSRATFSTNVRQGNAKYSFSLSINVSSKVKLWWPNGLGGQPSYRLLITVCSEDGKSLYSVRSKVWQDFMFACAMYPTDDDFLRTVREEVYQQIWRLKSHPSVIVWSANNENEAALATDWFHIPGWRRSIYLKDYVTLYVNNIMTLVKQEDPSRPFLASSPTNGAESEREGYVADNPYDPRYGDTHFYSYEADCWDWRAFPRARLASEYGFQSWPSLAALLPVSVAEDRSFNSRFADHRQHHLDGNQQMLKQASIHFPLPNSSQPLTRFTHTLYLTQVTQAQCVKTQTEFYRRSRSELLGGLGHTMGALYWQLNDIWQGPSWSSIEFGGKWKMLHYFAVDFFADVLPVAFEDDGELLIYAISDLSQDLKLNVVVSVYKWSDLDPICMLRSKSAAVPGGSAVPVFKRSIAVLLVGCGNCSRLSCLLAFHLEDENGARHGPVNHHFLCSPKDAVGLRPPNITAKVRENETELLVDVESQAIAPFVWLDVGDVEGRFGSNGFLMLSRKKTVAFHARRNTSVTQLSRALTVISLSDLYLP
ncbi:beta-mannosidase isoform X3 [Corythoichthys intestinalis]|uniref:beta-mannosidase isoform X3 n=1 Tax=Corythoichthys intestinalis TaxID=161448 RepID=UPI0025A5B37C|nr:beta-mannosidase isoform X3 [Corythoichthys intestinalis]